MPNGLPITWEDYKAYLREITKGVDYPGLWDKPERAADLERLIKEAEAILGPNPEAVFTSANLSRLMSLPYFSPAFEYASGMPLTQWHTLYSKTLPEEPELTPEEEHEWWRKKQEYEWQLGARWTPQEREQLGFRERELTWEQERFRLEQAAAGRQLNLEQEFESFRKDLLLQLTGPGDWIKNWMLKNMPNPYKPPERLKKWQQQKPAGMSLAEAGREGYWLPPSAVEKMGGKGWPAQIGGYFKPRKEIFTGPGVPGVARLAEEIGGQPFRAARKYRPPPKTPTTPPAPPWLSQFAPSQVAGQPVTPGQISPPSGQLWARTPWSQRQMLGGYAEFAGQSYEDILAQMAMMQPVTPLGIRQRRWTPTRQWA